MLSRHCLERFLGVGDLLVDFLGFALERRGRVHVGSHLSPAGEQLGIVAKFLEGAFVVGQDAGDRVGVGFVAVANIGDQCSIGGPSALPSLVLAVGDAIK